MSWLSSIKDLVTGNLFTIKAAAIALGVGLVAGGIIGWHEKALRVPALLQAQMKADTKQCNAEKAITRKTNDQLQNDNTRIASALAEYKRLHPVSPVIPAGQPQLRGSGAQCAGGNGAVAGSTDNFREYAARCELYRSSVIACQQFLKDERGIK